MPSGEGGSIIAGQSAPTRGAGMWERAGPRWGSAKRERRQAAQPAKRCQEPSWLATSYLAQRANSSRLQAAARPAPLPATTR